jgi:hydroxyacylglutathione hydrolase
MLQIITIPSGTDNYIWLIKKAHRAIVIDPGEALAVKQVLKQQQLELYAILITHYHHDHIDGISELLSTHPDARCYGPEPQGSLPFPVTIVSEGQTLALQPLALEFAVMHLPGHTPEHVAYYGHGVLFCGDTLFAGGCGRVLGGTMEDLYASLQRIKALPPETLIYCAHEYTANNLAFCQRIEPDNPLLRARIRQTARLRQQGVPTVPSSLSDELVTNAFLRTHIPEVKHSAEWISMEKCENEIQVFASLREKKNNS